ncbi:MAG: hypothetical protein GX595_19715 [Lentisphaerae bacterium]|nr:hypothetical protein [Lentisphaerota bacterium]
MAEAKKEGIFAKLFGAKKSCCCNVRIEEVSEDDGSAPAKATKSGCCTGQAPGASAPGGKPNAGAAGRGRG